ITWPPTHSAPLSVRISASPPNATRSGCSGSSTGRKLELGRLAPLATSAMRPWWRENTSRIRLDSLQSYRCSTNAGSSPMRLLVAKAAHPRLVVSPPGTHLDPQLDEDLGAEQLLEFLPRLGADALEPLALVADHDGLVAVALHDDGRGDANEPAMLRARLLVELVDHDGRRVGELLARQPEQLLAHGLAA